MKNFKDWTLWTESEEEALYAIDRCDDELTATGSGCNAVTVQIIPQAYSYFDTVYLTDESITELQKGFILVQTA